MLNIQMYKSDVIRWRFGLLFLMLQLTAMGQQEPPPDYPPTIPGAEVETYKRIGDVEMRVWIFNPEGHSASDRRPAIVFFFGGGWTGGNPAHFVKHCEYLAARGMVTLAADYRVSSRHGVTANRCVEDAKSAVRWIRKHADRLGIDPNRIAAGGGSSGGHLAAATATLPMFIGPNDDLSISSRPDALILFNPAVVLSSIPGKLEFSAARISNLKKRTGVELESISPYHHVQSGMPPTIIFHGTADHTVPYKTVELFMEKMKSEGNRCVLIGYEGADHGFFNFGRNDNAAFIDTVYKMDAFLVSLGYLKGPPKTIHYE